jgi:hypothetical protein
VCSGEQQRNGIAVVTKRAMSVMVTKQQKFLFNAFQVVMNANDCSSGERTAEGVQCDAKPRNGVQEVNDAT